MIKKYKLYVLYNSNTFKIRYVGITTQKLKVRLYQHLKIKHKNSYKENWIKKINFKVNIKSVKSNLNKIEARKLEVCLIRKYKDSHKLVNLQDRGFCGDLKLLKKDTCDKISKTLKNKYVNGEIKINGGKVVYVYSNTGKFIKRYNSNMSCARNLNIPHKKVSFICNNKGYYKNYTFTRKFMLPLKNYIKCYDVLTGKLYLFFKKEELSKFLNVNGTPYNKHYNTNFFYKGRYNIRYDNNLPPKLTSYIIHNNNYYPNLSKLLKTEKNLSSVNYKKIRTCLNNNTIFKIENHTITNLQRAWYKLDELRETL